MADYCLDIDSTSTLWFFQPDWNILNLKMLLNSYQTSAKAQPKVVQLAIDSQSFDSFLWLTMIRGVTLQDWWTFLEVLPVQIKVGFHVGKLVFELFKMSE